MDYEYNIRGWLTKINDPATFTENDQLGIQLYYNTAPTGGTALCNGNISGMKWGTPTYSDMLYRFSYDWNNRLTTADFYKSGYATYAFLCYYGYDFNGNITDIERHKMNGSDIDGMYISNSGNRIESISDYSFDDPNVVDYPGIDQGYEYEFEYDANGNLLYEPNKLIEFEYNLINLPTEADFGSNRKINYFYTFDGAKLRQTVEDNGTITKADYCGPFVYETVSGVRSLKYLITPEGRAVKNGSTWEYEYNLKDHLGNTRAVIHKGGNGLAEPIQERHYYPFGMEMSELSSGTSTNKFLYNSKEHQNDFELDWYDYGARFYDPELGRWHSVDPLSEKSRRFSPYTYTVDNPIRFIDPDGMSASDFKDKDDNLITHVDDGSNAVYKLEGTDQTNEYFKFDGYNNQGGKDEVSIEGAISGAQDYVTNNYDKCNRSVNFVGRTYESATEAQGKTIDNIGIVTGTSMAATINSDLANKVTPEKSVISAQESAAKGNLVVGAKEKHVVTMTTKTFDITRYNTSGSVVEQKQIIGGKIANVNGSPRPTNIGPEQKNSFQNPTGQPDLIWYSLPRK